MRQPSNTELLFDGFHSNGFIDVVNDSPQSIHDAVIDQPGGDGSSYWEGATGQGINTCPDITEIATIKTYLTSCYSGRDWLSLLGNSQIYNGLYSGWMSISEIKAFVSTFGDE